jgi:hypothetical protein
VKPRRTASPADLFALIVVAGMLAAPPSRAAETDSTYLGRPIYSDPSNGLQLPPTCNIEPTWRSRIAGTEMEIWVLNCDSTARIWLLTRQIVEMLSAHEGRLRFQVIDERVLRGETAGESLSVQCSVANDAAGIVVYGARWRNSGRELRLASARGTMRADVARRRLIDTDLSGVDCVRFPDREAMMRKLQQPERSSR